MSKITVLIFADWIGEARETVDRLRSTLSSFRKLVAVILSAAKNLRQGKGTDWDGDSSLRSE